MPTVCRFFGLCEISQGAWLVAGLFQVYGKDVFGFLDYNEESSELQSLSQSFAGLGFCVLVDFFGAPFFSIMMDMLDS